MIGLLVVALAALVLWHWLDMRHPSNNFVDLRGCAWVSVVGLMLLALGAIALARALL